VEVAPDLAVLGLEVSHRDPDRQAALERARDGSEALRAVLSSAPGVRRLVLSRLSVVEAPEWDGSGRPLRPTRWQASVSGSVEADTGQAGAVAAAAAGAGAQVQWVDWRVADDNPGHREVRRAAVADAARAALDFADALGRPLGDLQRLADPGVPGGAVRAQLTAARAEGGGPSAGKPVDLDPQPVTLQAGVEATYALGTADAG
jgi:uncharacterized protein YggE